MSEQGEGPQPTAGEVMPKIVGTENKQPESGVSFYITDHSADLKAGQTREQRQLRYKELASHGITSVRYDWRWNAIESHAGQVNPDQLETYRLAREDMLSAGLQEPTIILSSPPKWAVALLQEGRKGQPPSTDLFDAAWSDYATTVRDSLAQTQGNSKVTRIQVLNELNNPVYTPTTLPEFAHIAGLTKEIFQQYNPDTKIMATVLAGSVSNLTAKVGQGTSIKDFLPNLKAIKDSFDVLAIDYYPGSWHFPKLTWENRFKQLGLLKNVMENVATWGKAYELGEVGMNTNGPFSNEREQRRFYDEFSQNLRHVINDMHNRGLQTPDKIGLYTTTDEPANHIGKLISMTGLPVDFGIESRQGAPKQIIQGNLHTGKGPSRLSEVIKYLNMPYAPVAESKKANAAKTEQQS